MLRLEPRAQPSTLWRYASPVLALAITVILGVGLFMALGKDPVRGLGVFFWEPIKNVYALSELMVKATPLLLIALGLAVCFRSNVWNIGAEGQFVMGAVFASGVALMADANTGSGFWVLILLAGVVGGMVWASLTAVLRDRFNASEILVSLMLVYVAVMALNYLVYGPWKDPLGYNFPQTKTFDAITQIPKLITGTRVNIGVLLAHMPVLCSRWAAWRPTRPVTPASHRARPCGSPCSRLVLLRVWQAAWKWLGLCVSSRPLCLRAMALPPSSWRLWGACIRWAWCCRRY